MVLPINLPALRVKTFLVMEIFGYISKSRQPEYFQTVLSAILSFVNGATFSVGIFAVSVQSSSKLHALDGVWESALGYVHLFSAPIMVLAGVYLSQGQSRTRSLRHLSALGAAGFALVALSALTVRSQSALATSSVLSFLALPLGIYSLISAEISMQCNSNAPGLALGIVSVAFGLGSAFYAYIFDRFLSLWSLDTALIMSSVALVFPCLISTPFLSLPDFPNGESDDSEAQLIDKGKKFCRISLRELWMSRDFWLFIMGSLTAGASYALVPYFFVISSSFGVSRSTAVGAFQISSVGSVIFNLASTALADQFVYGDGSFSIGSRNVMVAMLLFQTMLSGVLSYASIANWYGLFACSAGILKLIMAAHASCSALLARDIFGAVNSALVIGVGCGLALGSGEALSVFLMYVMERCGAQSSVATTSPMTYYWFYYVLILWSVLGLIALLFVRCHSQKI